MAAAVTLMTQIIHAYPFLIRKYTVTAGTDGLAITHGEDREPDMIWWVNTTANPTASEASVVRTSATAVTIDHEGAAGTGNGELYLVWLSQASGGISA